MSIKMTRTMNTMTDGQKDLFLSLNKDDWFVAQRGQIW